MAIQMRRGTYSDFDPAKMVAGEIAFVTSGDPNSENGRAVYGCFEAGTVKRFATYEDLQNYVNETTTDIQTTLKEGVADAISKANTATTNANTATSKADTATTKANKAATNAEDLYNTLKNVDVSTLTEAVQNCLSATGQGTTPQAKTITDLTETDSSALDTHYVVGSGGVTLFKMTFANLAKKIASISLSSFATTAKTIIGAINEINASLSDKSGTLAVEAVTKSDISIVASTNGVCDFTCSMSGYTLLACTGFKVTNSSSSGVNSSMINVYAAYKYSNTVCRVLYRNTSTSAAKVDIAVYALFVKD